MSLRCISAEKAKELLETGALLVDIRGADEYARERIPAARNVPITAFDPAAVRQAGASAVIFHCRSGARTNSHQATLASCVDRDAYILEGGIDAWKRAGLPVELDRKQPLELMRQVQIAAGGMVVIGAALGATVHPAFHGLSAFVGAGLVFAGTTGICALARALKLLPWNRRMA